MAPGSTMLPLCRSACCSAVFAPIQVPIHSSKNKLHHGLPHCINTGSKATLWHKPICMSYAFVCIYMLKMMLYDALPIVPQCGSAKCSKARAAGLPAARTQSFLQLIGKLWPCFSDFMTPHQLSYIRAHCTPQRRC